MIKKSVIMILILFAFSSIVYADVETEPNNDMATSDILVSGKSMTGQLSSETDEDWFSFSVTAPDTINIKFTNSYCAGCNSSSFWQIIVKDSNENILSNTSTGGTFDINVGVASAGKYYVVVKKGTSFYQSAQYTLTVSALNVSPGCPNACTQEQLNTVYGSGYQAGLAACLANPASCGINVNPGDAVTLTSDFKMHLPNIQYNTILGTMSMWADLAYDGTKTDAGYFKITGAGSN